MVSYTVTDANNNLLFTSKPVAATLNVLTTLSTIDLGNLDTTNFALGQDTITVTVADASGNPIPGATGTGTLLIGTPVTATLSTTPTSLPPGDSTVTTTLQIDGQALSPSALSIAGQAAIMGASGVATDGTLAYVGTSAGIDVVDISDPTTPNVLSTFGAGDLAGLGVVAMQVYRNELVVLGQPSSGGPSTLLIYSLASPATPMLLGQTTLEDQANLGYSIEGFTISNDHVYTTAHHSRFFLSDGQIFEQYGQSFDVDISNPASPTVDSVIYNSPPNPSFFGSSGFRARRSLRYDREGEWLDPAEMSGGGGRLDEEPRTERGLFPLLPQAFVMDLPGQLPTERGLVDRARLDVKQPDRRFR